MRTDTRRGRTRESAAGITRFPRAAGLAAAALVAAGCSSVAPDPVPAEPFTTSPAAPSPDGLAPGTAVMTIIGGDETPTTWSLRQYGGISYDTDSTAFYYMSFLDDPDRPRDSSREQYLDIGVDNERPPSLGETPGKITIGVPPSKYYESDIGGTCTLAIIAIDDITRRGTFACSGLGGRDRETGRSNGKSVEIAGAFAYKRTRS